MKDKIKILLRTGFLGGLILLMICVLNSFFQPVWLTLNNYYSISGFYEEPENRIETLFLGSSVGAYGFSPMELYREYGICAYTIATQEQPLLASYYWAMEAYRLHPETLKNIVLDVSELRKAATDSNVHTAIDGMKLSPIKIRAAGDYANRDFSKTLSYLLTLTTYHSRWNELEMTDFEKYGFEEINGTRGFEFTLMNYMSTVSSVDELSLVGTELDENAESAEFPWEPVNYFNRLLAFCREKGITLTLVKTPTDNWDSSLNRAVQQIADKEGLTFLDFNFSPLIEEIGYIHPYDSREGKHLNYYGTRKLMEYIGKYLTENCTATDVRENDAYSYMSEQYEMYDALYCKQFELSQTQNIREALEAAVSEDNTVFITIKEDGAAKLSNNWRYYFRELGLEKLYSISSGDSYIGIITPDGVTYEAVGQNGELLTYETELPENVDVILTSGIKDGEYIASCLLDGKEAGRNASGINISVYNNKYNEFVYSIAFATNSTAGRYFYRFDFCSILGNSEEAKTHKNNPYMKNILAYNERVQQNISAENNKKVTEAAE